MKRIYYRLNWKDYLKSGNLKNESKDELYSLLFSEVKSALSKRKEELCIAADTFTRTMILIPIEEYKELLEECLMYFQIRENYEQCIEIKNTLEKIKIKKFRKRKPTTESNKLILIRLNQVTDE
jgi:hypothetical protein